MDAATLLKRYRGIVWHRIQKYLTDPIYPPDFAIPNQYSLDLAFHWRLVKEYPLRQGKYLRPTLLILAAQAMGASCKQALPAAAAMQLSEDWLLIHDDIEDDSLVRRGQPTLHRLYGPELAINAGDALQIIMWKIIWDTGRPDIATEFYRMLSRTALGQTTEIKWTKDNKTNFADPDWFFICDGKTSYYTIAGPLRLGAIIAGATVEQLAVLARFGLYLGRCFQLVDDILDLTSDFSGLKKQTGNDIYEGKRTVMLGHLLRTASSADKKKVISILSRSRDQKSPVEVKWIIECMQHYGSLEYARKLASTLKDQAHSIFKSDLRFLSQSPYRGYLDTLIAFVLERKH